MVTVRAANLLKQQLSVEASVSGANCIVRCGTMRCTIQLQPSPLSCVYTILIEYRLGVRPRVTVEDPVLELRADARELPHVYRDGSLCLHMRDEWKADQLIGRTVVPWIAEWLFYYELWLATGAWLGGGHEFGARIR